MPLTIREAIKETHDSATRATVIAASSLMLAVLAFVASSVSVYFSYLDSETDDIWQKEQIASLITVSDDLKSQNEILKKLAEYCKQAVSYF